MKQILFVILSLFFLFSCQNKKEYKEYDCYVDKKIEMFNDSSFFSDIRCMQYCDGKIYILDVMRKDIVILNEDFDDMQIIGTPGPGPKDLTHPGMFYVLQDSIYVMDFGSESIKSFYKNNYLRDWRLHFSEKRFFCTQDKLYLPSLTDTSTFVIKEKDDKEKMIDKYGGKITKFRTDKETFIRNHKNLLWDNNNFFYAISDNLTRIEKYNLQTLEFVSEFDISTIPIVKNNLNFIRYQEESENSYYVLVRDVYLANNFIYLLLTNIIPPFKANQLLKINIYPEMKVTSIYSLPGSYYDSFCVSKNHIFAFNRIEGTIERIKLVDYE